MTFCNILKPNKNTAKKYVQQNIIKVHVIQLSVNNLIIYYNKNLGYSKNIYFCNNIFT